MTTTPKTSYRQITITEKDIAKAERNNSHMCVVAQAIARTIPDAHHIEVDTQTIRFTDRDQRKVYLTPYAVQGYVVAFDAGDKIEPFSFQLRNPVPVRRKALTRAGRHRQQASIRARRQAIKNGASDAPAQARAAYAVAKSEQPGPFLEPPIPNERKSFPRVFKKKSRAYGMRVLRINRERQAELS